MCAPSLRFSVTVSSEKVPRPSGTWAIPFFATDSGPPRPRGLPAKRIFPARFTVFEIARSVVVLPAPLAPSTAAIWPSSTVSVTPCSALIGP